MTILTTRRLVLRPLQSADAPAMFAILGDSAAMEFWGRAAFPRLGTVEALLADELAAMAAGGFLYWTVLKDGAAIGGVDLSHIDGTEAWTGFLFRRDHWGRGYAGEALGAVIGHAFGAMGLAHVMARIRAGNGRAARVLERAGFYREIASPDPLDAGRPFIRYALDKSSAKKGA